MRKRYNKKILTTTNYIESQIALEERVSKIVKILKEDACPSTPVETIQDIFQDGQNSFNLDQEPEDLEDSIAQWGARVADKIRCLNTNDTIRLFGGGFVASYVKDFNSIILRSLGVSQEPWNEILSVALLYIKMEEIPSIIRHWNAIAGNGTVPGTENHPENAGGEWFGCEMVSDAIVRGAIQHYGIARLKSLQTLRRAAQGSKVAAALTALFASPRFVKAMEISTGMGIVMEMDEVKAAREEITIEVCKIDGLEDIAGIGVKIGQLATRIRTGVSDEEEDGPLGPGQVEEELPDVEPPAAPTFSCPAGKMEDPDSPGTCIDIPECPEGQVIDASGACQDLGGMYENKKATINTLREQLKVRGFKGFGSSQAFIDRKPTNLGKSVVEKYLDENEEDKKDIENKQKVKVSKAFARNNK